MNFESSTQTQMPQISNPFRCNGYINTAYSYPMQNSSFASAPQNGMFPIQTSPLHISSLNQISPNNGQNIQFVLCSDQTVFLPDRFEVYIDARGFSPTDVKINITSERVEVLADKVLPPIANTMSQYSQKHLILSRIYILPQKVVPEMGMCSFKDECLIIAAPWARQ